MPATGTEFVNNYIKKYYSISGIYFFTFLSLGTLLPLIGQYLDGIGFSGIQIGIVTSTATAVGIGASPFWGYRSHHSRDSSLVLMLLCVTAALIIVGLSFIKLFLVFLFAYAVFSFFQAPIMPLTDAMTLENELPYGAVRKWSSIGYSVGVSVAGQMAQATSPVIIFPLCMLGYIAAWALIARLRKAGHKEQISSGEQADLIQAKQGRREPSAPDPAPRPESGKKARQGSYLQLFRNRKLMVLLLAAFFFYGTNVGNNTYFGFLYRDGGGSIAGVGIAFLLMCCSEAFFMNFTEKLEKICPMEKMILISMIVSALRFLWYSTGPSSGFLLGTFFLQGLANGIFLIQLVRYIARFVDPAMIGMAMALYQAVSANCSAILCQFIGGAVLDHFGPAQVYLFFSIYNAISILLYVGFRLYKCSDQTKKE